MLNGMRDELRYPGCVVLVLCLAAGSASAQNVYRSVDENGVVTFSDVATEDAVRVELPAPVVRENALAEQRSLIEQQLEVAKALEASRLAREASRTERLEALAASRPDTTYYREEDQAGLQSGSWFFTSGFWNGGRWPGNWPGHRPGHRPPRPEHPIEPPAPEVPSRRVPLPPLKPD